MRFVLYCKITIIIKIYVILWSIRRLWRYVCAIENADSGTKKMKQFIRALIKSSVAIVA